jgi:hypothetical protein
MTLVGMKVHLAIRQRADQLPVLADIGDQHHRRVRGGEPFGVRYGGRSKTRPEPHLIVFIELLIAKENDEVPVPGVQHLRKQRVAHGLAEVDADDFGPDARGQGPHLEEFRGWSR